MYVMKTGDKHTCSSCGAQTTNWCSKCRATWYCSTPCQESAWTAHKTLCSSPTPPTDCAAAAAAPSGPPLAANDRPSRPAHLSTGAVLDSVEDVIDSVVWEVVRRGPSILSFVVVYVKCLNADKLVLDVIHSLSREYVKACSDKGMLELINKLGAFTLAKANPDDLVVLIGLASPRRKTPRLSVLG